MEKKSIPTLKDIASATGYSLSSIHRAIYNKEGLKEETRQQILKIVNDMGYEVNYLASSLKRKNVTVAYVGKRIQGFEDYHSMMADGAKSAFKQFEGMNISFKEFLFNGEYSDYENKEIAILEEIYNGDDIDGVVIFPINTSQRMRLAIQKIISKGVDVVLVDDYFSQMDFLCSVAPSSFSVGATAAEFMKETCNSGKILITTGNPDCISHYENYQGFVRYMNSIGKSFVCVPFSNDYGEEELAKRILAAIDESVVGIYAVCETDSRAICKAVLNSGRTDLSVVGCDLCKENREYLQDGVFLCVIDTDPFIQGYFAMRKLLDCVLKNIKPEAKFYSAPISIVMKSNLPFFGNQRPYGVSITLKDSFNLREN